MRSGNVLGPERRTLVARVLQNPDAPLTELRSAMLAAVSSNLTPKALEFWRRLSTSHACSLTPKDFFLGITALGKAGKAVEACKELAHMTRLGKSPDIACLTAATLACSFSGRTQAGLELIEKSERLGMNMEPSVIRGVFLSSYTHKDHVSAVKTFRKMCARQMISTKDVEMVSTICVENQDIESLLKITKFPNQRYAVIGLMSLVSVYARKREYQEVFSKLDLFYKRGVVFSPRDYNRVLKNICDNGDFHEAVQFLKLMIDHQCKIDRDYCISPILKCAAVFGSEQDVDNVLTLLRLHGLSPNHFNFNAIISGLIKKGRDFDVDVWLSKMESQGLRMGPITLNIVVHHLYALGQFDKCIQLFKEFQQKSYELPAAPALSIVRRAVIDKSFPGVCDEKENLSDFLKAFAQHEWLPAESVSKLLDDASADREDQIESSDAQSDQESEPQVSKENDVNGHFWNIYEALSRNTDPSKLASFTRKALKECTVTFLPFDKVFNSELSRSDVLSLYLTLIKYQMIMVPGAPIPESSISQSLINLFSTFQSMRLINTSRLSAFYFRLLVRNSTPDVIVSKLEDFVSLRLPTERNCFPVVFQHCLNVERYDLVEKVWHLFQKSNKSYSDEMATLLVKWFIQEGKIENTLSVLRHLRSWTASMKSRIVFLFMKDLLKQQQYEAITVYWESLTPMHSEFSSHVQELVVEAFERLGNHDEALYLRSRMKGLHIQV
jgi:pentatricopeptide repeat protein